MSTQYHAELVPVYDIVRCGPRSRYAANGKLVHNCDGINLQNLPSRGAQANKLKKCIEAPPGHILIDCDSSNIEARVLAWLSGQDDLVQDFANNVDVYCKLATSIYGRPITKANTTERFVGKTTVLGCGYGTGFLKLQATLKASSPPLDLSEEECQRIIDTYRNSVPRITALWRQGEAAIQAMHADKTMWFGREGVVLIEGRRGVKLPSGLYIQYPQLHMGQKKSTFGILNGAWMYKDDTGMVTIYGSKFVENVVQGLARIIVMYQMLKIAKRYRTVLTVHDAVAALVPVGDVSKAIEYNSEKKCYVPVSAEAKEAVAYVEQCMRWLPKWAEGCPINCESGMGPSYGDC